MQSWAIYPVWNEYRISPRELRLTPIELLDHMKSSREAKAYCKGEKIAGPPVPSAAEV